MDEVPPFGRNDNPHIGDKGRSIGGFAANAPFHKNELYPS